MIFYGKRITMKPRMTLALLAAALLASGCATYDPPVMVWRAARDDAAPLARAHDRCDYEATSATQSVDYSYRFAWERESDRSGRRNDLMKLCMRAQGYEQTLANREGIGPQPAAKWAEMEKSWSDANRERAKARAALTANPSGPDSERFSERIRQLNTEVRHLERQLSYALTPPVSADPAR